MPEIRVSIALPYALRLAEGVIRTSRGGEEIHLSARTFEGLVLQTVVAATFHHAENPDPNEKVRVRDQDADRLLRRTNRMLRWYRAVHKLAEITELTRAQASPFLFELVGPGDPAGWIDPIEYEGVKLVPLSLSIEEITEQVRDGLAGDKDPDVDVLFLLDAERALQQG